MESESLKKKKISQNKDYSISFARFVAMSFIVVCHIMQRDEFASDINGAHIEWAFWFNIGVQMFLYISGYLYGKKNKIDVVEFYKKSFSKILIEYYVFITVMLVVIHYSPLWDVDNNSVVDLLTFSGTIPGLGHLWFISTILFCYLFVPIFSEILNVIDKRSSIRFCFESFILLLIVHIVVKFFFESFNSAWINCFIIGMLYSRIEQKKNKHKYAFTGGIIVLCLLIIPLQFRIDYWEHSELPSFFCKIYGDVTDYGHVFLGIGVVLLIRFVYNRTNYKSKNHYVLNWSDKYSYDVYLVHHVFIQSMFGCVEFISNRLVALPLAIILTVLFSVFLYLASDFIRKKSIDLYRRLPN